MIAALDRLHARVRRSVLLERVVVATRCLFAMAFVPTGLVKAMGERFTETGAPAGIGGTVQFRTDVYDTATIETLVQRLHRVLTSVTADPTVRLSTVDLLDGDERARLDAWGNRAALTEPAPAATSLSVVLNTSPRVLTSLLSDWSRPLLSPRSCASTQVESSSEMSFQVVFSW